MNMTIQKTNQNINQAIKNKFGQPINQLNSKQVHILNQHQLYTPKQWINKIYKDVNKQVKDSKISIKKHHQHLDKSILDGMGHNPDDIGAIRAGKARIKAAPIKRKYLPQAVEAHKDYILLQRDNANFKPASLDSINQISEQIKVTKQASKSVKGTPRHIRYMKIKHNPRLLALHRKGARKFDRSVSHYLGSRRWRIKRGMKKPHSKWYKYTKQGLSPQQVFNIVGVSSVSQYKQRQTMNKAGISQPNKIKHFNHHHQQLNLLHPHHSQLKQKSVNQSRTLKHDRGMQL